MPALRPDIPAQCVAQKMTLPLIPEGVWQRPVMRGYLIQCCDCGLIHRMNFKVNRRGKKNEVLFQVFRNKSKKVD